MFKPKILRIIGFIFLFLSCTKQEALVFEKLNFNENWLFKIIENSKKDTLSFQENETVSNWQLVQLPHTPKIEPKIVNNQWQGISCYKKEFNLSKQLKNKKLFFKKDEIKLSWGFG
jgi:beta-galactosidase